MKQKHHLFGDNKEYTISGLISGPKYGCESKGDVCQPPATESASW